MTSLNHAMLLGFRLFVTRACPSSQTDDEIVAKNKTVTDSRDVGLFVDFDFNY